MSEFRDPTTYNGISQKSFVAPTKLTAYLKILPDMGLVEREYPALTSTKMQGNAARGLDKISDRFLKFWFRFIASQSTEIPTVSAAATVWEHAVAPFFSEFASDAFEVCCKEYLVRRNFDGQLPFFASSIGRWWHKDQEIDIVATEALRKTCWSVNANIEQLRLPRKHCRISIQNAPCFRLLYMRRYIAICFSEPLLKDLSSKLKKRIKICIW